MKPPMEMSIPIQSDCSVTRLVPCQDVTGHMVKKQVSPQGAVVQIGKGLAHVLASVVIRIILVIIDVIGEAQGCN